MGKGTVEVVNGRIEKRRTGENYFSKIVRKERNEVFLQFFKNLRFGHRELKKGLWIG